MGTVSNSVSSEAFVAINNLVADYCLGYDAEDFDRFSGIWAQDAHFSAEPDLGVLPVPMQGRKAIVEAFAARRRIAKDHQSRHYAMNTSLTPGAEGTVNGLSAMLAIEIHSDGTAEVHRTGWYRDQFAQEDGVWRIKRRLLVYDIIGSIEAMRAHSTEAIMKEHS